MRAGPGATARISSSGLHDEGCNHRPYEAIRGPAQARPASALWRLSHTSLRQTLSPSAFAAAHHPSPQHRERERERHGESGTAASHVTEAASPSTSACKCSPRRPLLSPHSHEPCHRATSAIEPHLTQNSNAPMPSQAAGCARSHVAASSFALSGQSSIEALATIE